MKKNYLKILLEVNSFLRKEMKTQFKEFSWRENYYFSSMVLVRTSSPKVTNQSFKGMGIKKEGENITIEAIDGNITITDITEHHRTRVAFGITKNPHTKHKVTTTGSASFKSLSGLVIPLENDDMFFVLKETIIDVAALMNLPTVITDQTLMQAIKNAITEGEAGLKPSGNQLQVCPKQELIKARQWITSQVPASNYSKCNLLL